MCLSTENRSTRPRCCVKKKCSDRIERFSVVGKIKCSNSRSKKSRRKVCVFLDGKSIYKTTTLCYKKNCSDRIKRFSVIGKIKCANSRSKKSRRKERVFLDGKSKNMVQTYALQYPNLCDNNFIWSLLQSMIIS